MSTKLYLGGLPTAPDVKRLRERFPDNALRVGQIVDYADVEATLGCARHTYRFKTVTNRWRKLVEKESGVIIGAMAGKGFAVLDDHQKLDASGAKPRSAARAARRSYVLAGHIDRKNLTDEERGRLDHQGRVSAAVLAAASVRRTAELPTV